MKKLENNNDEDYWKELEGLDRLELLEKVSKFLNDPNKDQFTEWISERQEGILNSYIKGIKAGRQNAFNLSLHDFGVFLYISMRYKGGMIKGEKGELKPQTIKLQKELDQLYTPENIENELKRLGVFTDEDLDNDKRKET
jgi:hypothetical protein